MLHTKHSKSILFLINFISLLLISFTLNAQQAVEQRVGKISVVIHNLPKGSEVNEETILNQMKTKVNEPFSQNSFDEDLKHLSLSYSRVEPTIEVHGKELFITLNLWSKPVINKIVWEGNTHIKTKKLNKELGVLVGTMYERSAFVKEFNKVKLYYAKEGYYEAQLSYQVIPIKDENRVDIKITLDEGKAGKISKVLFTGLTEKETDELRSKVLTKEYFFLTSWYDSKGLLNKEMLEQDRLYVLQFLHDLGYANATVKTEIKEKSKSSDQVKILFHCVKGPLFICKKITFTGNTLFTNEQIQKVFALHTGNPFSPEKIRQTVRNITALYGSKGYIDCNVSYSPKLLPGEHAYSIDFTITEGKKYRVGMIKIFGNTSTHHDVILHESLIVPGEVFDSRKLEVTEGRLKNIGYFESVNVYAVQSDDTSLLGPTFRDIHIEVVETNTGNLSFFFGFSTLTNIFGGSELSERNFNYKGLSRLFTDGISAIRGGVSPYAFVLM